MTPKKESTAKAMHKPLPHDVTLGALLVVLLASAFLIVLPRLQALRALPEHYYNLLPVATQNDVDRDGISDKMDPTPFGHRDTGIGQRVHGSAAADGDAEDTESADELQ